MYSSHSVVCYANTELTLLVELIVGDGNGDAICISENDVIIPDNECTRTATCGCTRLETRKMDEGARFSNCRFPSWIIQNFRCSKSSWGCADYVSLTFFLQMSHWTWCFFVSGLMVVLRTTPSATMIDWFSYSKTCLCHVESDQVYFLKYQKHPSKKHMSAPTQWYQCISGVCLQFWENV